MPAEYGFERYLNVRSAYGASFSADGTRLSFLTDITGVAEVWSVPVDVDAPLPTWPTQLTFRGERTMEASFSPTEDSLLLTGDVGGNELSQLYMLKGDGSAIEEITHQPELIHTSAVWSPNGTRIAFSSNQRDRRYFDVYEYSQEHGTTRQLLRQDGTNYVQGYAPDGHQLLVSRFDSNIRNQLFLLNTTTGETRNLTPVIVEGPALHAFAAWSADNQGNQGLYLLSNRDHQFLSLAWLDLTTNELSLLARNMEKSLPNESVYHLIFTYS